MKEETTTDCHKIDPWVIVVLAMTFIILTGSGFLAGWQIRGEFARQEIENLIDLQTVFEENRHVNTLATPVYHLPGGDTLFIKKPK